jgi:hypothetical protein
MQAFAHVIAESNDGSWSAWFRHEPSVVSRGEDWAHAVAVLIDVHGSPKLKWNQIIAVEETTREGHAEFLIPYRTSARHDITRSVN